MEQKGKWESRDRLHLFSYCRWAFWKLIFLVRNMATQRDHHFSLDKFLKGCHSFAFFFFLWKVYQRKVSEFLFHCLYLLWCKLCLCWGRGQIAGKYRPVNAGWCKVTLFSSLLLAECKWRLAFTVVRREFRVTVAFFLFCHVLFTWPIFQSSCSFTQGENSSIILVASGEIQSCFKAALSDIAASHHFLLCPGYKDNLYYSVTSSTPKQLWLGPPPVFSDGLEVLPSAGRYRALAPCSRKAFYRGICAPELVCC